MIRGDVLLPIHWGTFNLAFHALDEPPDRLLVAAERENARVVIPRPGQQIEPASLSEPETWWRDVRESARRNLSS